MNRKIKFYSWMVGVGEPLETRPYATCYQAKCRRSRSNGTSVRMEIRGKNGMDRSQGHQGH